jgi:hypothetical protein
MQAIILYPDTRRTEVLVLSIGRYSMRVVPRNSVDTIEVTFSYGEWSDESGVPIEFESFVLNDDEDIRSILEMPEVCLAAS